MLLGSPSKNWASLASDATGKYIVASVGNPTAAIDQTFEGMIYLSNDFGGSWKAADLPTLNWGSVASDVTGQYLAAVSVGESIFLSNDFGATWVISAAPPNNYNGIACDSTGNIMCAATGGGSIFCSNPVVSPTAPRGSVWTGTGAAKQAWTGIAANFDGTSWSAVASGNGAYIGTCETAPCAPTFTESVSTNALMWSTTTSYDGTHIFAGDCNAGALYTSDGGSTWESVSLPNSCYTLRTDYYGKYVIAASYQGNGDIYFSNNYGSYFAASTGK